MSRYLKGRIVHDQVNKFIEAMNVCYKYKYHLLKQKKSSLNDFNRKQFEDYLAQRTKDTKGDITIYIVYRGSLIFLVL